MQCRCIQEGRVWHCLEKLISFHFFGAVVDSKSAASEDNPPRGLVHQRGIIARIVQHLHNVQLADTTLQCFIGPNFGSNPIYWSCFLPTRFLDTQVSLAPTHVSK